MSDKQTEITFNDLPLDENIVRAVHEAGYTVPTPVQAQSIPVLLNGQDLLVTSRTGSGKTAAFMLPALHKLTTSPGAGRGPRLLVLSPTRELANQITEAAKKYGKYLKQVRIVSILGGTSYQVQNRMLSKPYEILVATPGRLIDQMNQGRIDLSKVEMLVLDEADRMLDMGFIDDVERIASAIPEGRQTLLFSATMDREILRLANQLLKDPVRIEATELHASHENIEQRLHYVDDLAHKNRLLAHLLTDTAVNQAIVFTATKRDADLVASDLAGMGHQAAALHGDMNQGARNRTLDGLRRGRFRVLVATDVAARGIDVPGISHVINYDLPKMAEDYVHRIGRTGRAGNKGTAISLAGSRDLMHLKKIERFTGQSINVHSVPGYEPKRPIKASKPSSQGGQRHGRGAPGNGGGRTFSANRGDFQQRNSNPQKKRFEGGQPTFLQDERPRFDGERPRFDGERPRFDGERPRFDSARPRADGLRVRTDAPRSRPDGARGRTDAPRHRSDVIAPRTRTEGATVRADGTRTLGEVGRRKKSAFGEQTPLHTQSRFFPDGPSRSHDTFTKRARPQNPSQGRKRWGDS
ncbi:MAG TPA: DEAD/DEAH box helicase [Ferrovaceae bacterium]|nr:DEAD/DEAH box helicase [Ferrovaceae bacterium]HQU05856.1 DEAD/DEAH box helicase [Ferrovaceae bacterium]